MKSILSKILHFVLILSFLLSSGIIFPAGLNAQDLFVPSPSQMVGPSPNFAPTVLKGIKVDPRNPFQLDFIVDVNDQELQPDIFENETLKLVRYFLAGLTVPESDLWVNLSPYESDRIIPASFGKTEMGRDILSQDYLLKQMTASLMYPEEDIGADFWDAVYSKVQSEYGSLDVPLDTFNKVWIVPDRAEVFQKDNTALVVDSHLKVMMEEDYIAYKNGISNSPSSDAALKQNQVPSEVVKKIILPELEKEVNYGQHFAPLRQIYHALILSQWYKQALKTSLVSQMYVDQNKTQGIEHAESDMQARIYQLYLEAFKSGVFNYVKEEYDDQKQTIVPRKYFSGGITWNVASHMDIKTSEDDLSASGQDGYREIVLNKKNTRIVSVLLGYAKQGLGNVLASVKNKITKKILAAGMVGVFALPANSLAIAPNSLQLFLLDSDMFQITAKLLPSNPGLVNQMIDQNLDQMIQQYGLKNQGLIPGFIQLPILAQVFSSLPEKGPLSFVQVGAVVKQSLEANKKDIKKLKALEFELTRWIMDFLLSSADYDYKGLQEKDLHHFSLFRLLIGNEKSKQGVRTYVCQSISEAAVILGNELGIRESALGVNSVYEDADGNKYPNKDGIGHVILTYTDPDRTVYQFDQGTEPLVKKHKQIGPPENVDKLIETQNFFKEYNAIVLANNNVPYYASPQMSIKSFSDLKDRLERLLKEKGIERTPELVKWIASLKKTISYNLDLHKIRLENEKEADRDYQYSNIVLSFYKDILNDLDVLNDKAHDAFDAQDWKEAERLYSHVVTAANDRAKEFESSFKIVKNIVNAKGKPMTMSDLVQSIRNFGDVAKKNVESSYKNGVAAEEAKYKKQLFAEYKAIEAELNQLLATVPGDQIPVVVNQLKQIIHKSNQKANHRNMDPEIREFYKDLIVRAEENIKDLINFQNQFDRYKDFETRLNQFLQQISGQTMDRDSVNQVRQQFTKLRQEAERLRDVPDLDPEIREFYKDSIVRAEENIKDLINFQNQFDRYKDFETRLNQFLQQISGQTMDRDSVSHVRQQLTKLRQEAERLRDVPDLDTEIKGFYNDRIKYIDSILKQLTLSSLPTENGLMLASNETPSNDTEDFATGVQSENKGGIDFNQIDVKVTGDPIRIRSEIPLHLMIPQDFDGFVPFIIHYHPFNDFNW